MAKPKVLLLKGLPASGKSTYAKELTKQGWLRTNKDEIREMLFGGNYTKSGEKTVVAVRNNLIEEALKKGKDIVIDDTNLNPVHAKDIENIANKYGAEFLIEDQFLSVPIEVCIKRDLQRTKSVGENVIRDMYAKWIKVPPAAINYDPELPMAIIVDVDGTLAHMKDKRKPYEWHKVGNDEVDAGVAHLVDAVKFLGYAKVFIFSGRDSDCRPETEQWLERHDIEYDFLYMRPSKNNEDDREIKKRMFDEHVKGKYNVLFVVDDRPKVCRMWREELGLKVLQVGDPYYNF